MAFFNVVVPVTVTVALPDVTIFVDLFIVKFDITRSIVVELLLLLSTFDVNVPVRMYSPLITYTNEVGVKPANLKVALPLLVDDRRGLSNEPTSDAVPVTLSGKLLVLQFKV